MRNKTHYQVRPRYTPGSPAQVPQHVALRVAEQEPRFYERALSGVWGDKSKQTAETEGLDFIAYTMQEKRGGWEILDLITEKRHFWPTTVRCGKCNRLATVRCGVVQSHQTYNQLAILTCNPLTYVGEERHANA
jgi:hypothetical protein